MDYNEWLLDQYTLNVAPLTATDGFGTIVGIIGGGAVLAGFAQIVIGYFSDSAFVALMPTIKKTYNDSVFVPIDNFLEGTLTTFLNQYSLTVVANLLDQIWEGGNYIIVDVIFAFLAGDLTRDSSYA